MRYLPAFHDVAGRIVVVVGTTPAAKAKAALAENAGALVRRVVTPAPADLGDAALVFVATGDAERDMRAAALARSEGIPVNVVDRPGLGSFVMGAVVDRAPITVAICTGGAAPVLAQHLRRVIERAVPAGYGRLAQLLGAARDAIRHAVPDAARRRDFYARAIQGRIGAAAMAGNPEQAAAALAREIAAARLQRIGAEPGSVHLVAVGPGDPDLLTVKALRLLGEADVIVHDASVAADILARGRREAEYIAADSSGSSETAERIVRSAHVGKAVLCLSADDPMRAAGGPSILARLARRGVFVEDVPGVPASAPAVAVTVGAARRS